MKNSSFDIAVIGGGIAGASVAAHLSRERRVVLLEGEERPGYHATGRSAALYSTTYGPEPIRALTRASRAAFDTGFGTPAITVRGALYIATSEQIPRLENFAALPEVAAETRPVTGDIAAALCPILRADHRAAMVYEAGAADIDVDRVHQTYLRWFRERGGTLLTRHRVTALDRDGAEWRLTCADQVIRAAIVVNAAGAWADEIARMAGAATVSLQPMRRTALLVDPPDPVGFRHWPAVIDIDEQFYFKPDAGQLLLSCADETPSPPCDAQPEEMDVAIAVDRVEAATSLKVARIRHRWAGLRSFVPDRVPVVGYDPGLRGFFWLAGQGGYGIQTAPALSLLAAALVLERPVPADLAKEGIDDAALSPARFQGG